MMMMMMILMMMMMMMMIMMGVVLSYYEEPISPTAVTYLKDDAGALGVSSCLIIASETQFPWGGDGETRRQTRRK